MKTKELILLRHAHRDTHLGAELDNSLSERGKIQSQELIEKLTPSLSPSSLLIFSSPKKRCKETLTPLSTYLNVSIKVNPLIDEQSPSETESDMRVRINNFIIQLSHLEFNQCLVCSHADWIPTCSEILNGTWLDVEKAQWIRIALN